MQFEIKRFPQWKQLYEAAVPLIDEGMRQFTYEELSNLAGMDITTDAGRSQFYRFRKTLLREKALWMENDVKKGYSVIAAKDQPTCAYKRVRAAKRKIGMATAINSYVRAEDLTPEQRCMQAATAVVLHELGKAFVTTGKKLAVVAKEMGKVDVDLDKLVESISGKPGKILKSA